ncbi:MAG: MATE family efflux transporter, partial [Lachnospiraceae bacterium]|nr:MATE family efflux transporter [Lachnospiraceae bacterium]
GEQNMLLQQTAETGLKIYFTAIPFVGFNIVISAYFTSTEKVLPAQVISLARGFVVIVPMAFILSFLFKMTGVWTSYPLTEGIVALTGMIFYKKQGGKRNV